MKPLTAVEFFVQARTTGARLAARPTGVVHLYSGPTTPSGLHSSRGWPAVCRTRSRRLAMLEEAPILLNLAQGRRRLCGRCSVRPFTPPALGRAEQWAGVTGWVCAVWLWLARTPNDIDLVDRAMTAAGVPRLTQILAPTGKSVGCLHDRRRHAVHRVT